MVISFAGVIAAASASSRRQLAKPSVAV